VRDEIYRPQKMLTFALAVFLLKITPRPGVLSLAGAGAAYGWRQGFLYRLVCSLALTLFALRLFWALQLQSWQTQLFERCC
jgi:threonine/homoserine/homoserine lactone efflux protein